MLNTLTESSIRAIPASGGMERLTLPGVMAALVRGEIASFPALRPHQRHVWHAFLVQLATLALLKADRGDLPEEQGAWRDLIRALTPDWQEDEPWSLVVEDVSKPALLQPPVPLEEFTSFKHLETPDALDMLVTAKNHDFKSDIAIHVQPDDWLFALLSLQTQEGVLGSGKYGISRMNGGYGSRAGLGIAIGSDPGRRFRRDIERLLAVAGEDETFPEWQRRDGGGLALLWLEPWAKNDASLAPDRLERLYIEICRRVRLINKNGRLAARDGGSKAPRIATKDFKGNTGDLWMPIEHGEAKALSITGDGFTYRKMVDLLDSGKYTMPVLGKIYGNDPSEGLQLLATGLARGQGKTEGYHERSIPIPNPVKSLFALAEGRGTLAHKARDRVEALGKLRSALHCALFIQAKGGREIDPEEWNREKRNISKFIKPWLDRFEAEVDRGFFPELWRELGEETPDAQLKAYGVWKLARRRHAEALLDEASEALPLPVARRYRAKVKAKSAFHGALRKYEAFKDTYSNQAEEAASQ